MQLAMSNVMKLVDQPFGAFRGAPTESDRIDLMNAAARIAKHDGILLSTVGAGGIVEKEHRIVALDEKCGAAAPRLFGEHLGQSLGGRHLGEAPGSIWKKHGKKGKELENRPPEACAPSGRNG